MLSQRPRWARIVWSSGCRIINGGQALVHDRRSAIVMGKPIQREEAEQVSEQIAFMVSKLWQWHEGDFCPVDSWTPAVNVYRADDRIEVCIDVAGMDRRSIEVRVESGRLVVQGVPDSPEPPVS